MDSEETENIDDIEREITENFLLGKLSFTEYAAQMESESDANESEPSTDEPSTSSAPPLENKPKRKQIRRSAGVLPVALKGLVGEANVRLARGDHVIAEKMCLEVIRQVPTAPEPYFTLAQIYEKRDPDKSLQFDLIAAHLNPYNEDQWLKLGMMSENVGNVKQADTCYAKAIVANITNIGSHIKRINLLESAGEIKAAIKAKYRALNYMKAQHVEIMIPMAKELAKIYFDEGDLSKAKDCLNVVFDKCPEQVTPELVNMMLELLLNLKQFKQCLEILVQYCNIDVELETDVYKTLAGQIEEKINVISYQLPEIIQIDLHIKFICCLIHLKSFDLIEPLLCPLLANEEDVEKNGDLYLDVAEALMDEELYRDALKLLIPLVKSKNFGLSAVWLRQAECLNKCQFYEQAVDSYKMVTNLEPDHNEVRYPLSELLIKLDRKGEAVSVLEQDENYEVMETGLLYKKCRLLKELKMYNKFWSASYLLLSRHSLVIRNRYEIGSIISTLPFNKKYDSLKQLRKERGEDPLDAKATYNNVKEPLAEEEFTFYKDLMRTCFAKKRYDLLQKFSFTCLGSKRFHPYRKETELIAIFSCIYNRDYFNGYNLVRELVQRNLSNRNCWNLYNIMIQKSDDSRHNRFLMRLLSRINTDMNLNILHANNCLIAGTYKYALSEYVALYKMREEPLLALLIGITLFQMASQKFSDKKNYLVVQGIGFFNAYKKLRGPDGLQEVYYNIGRSYHQMGLFNVAIAYYNKVLSLPPAVPTDRNIFDLKQEAAFNLHLIYRNSGSHDLANLYLLKYIVV